MTASCNRSKQRQHPARNLEWIVERRRFREDLAEEQEPGQDPTDDRSDPGPAEAVELRFQQQQQHPGDQQYDAGEVDRQQTDPGEAEDESEHSQHAGAEVARVANLVDHAVRPEQDEGVGHVRVRQDVQESLDQGTSELVDLGARSPQACACPPWSRPSRRRSCSTVSRGRPRCDRSHSRSSASSAV